MSGIKTSHALVVLASFLIISLLFIASTSSIRRDSTSLYVSPTTQRAAINGAGSGLIAHYAFDEGSGTTAADSAGSTNATLSDGVGWESGVMGSAVNFNSPTAAVVVPDEPIGSGDVTVTAWIKPSSLPYIGMIVTSGNDGFSLFITNSSKRLQCNNGGTPQAYGAYGSINANVWQFVSAVRTSDGKCTMYLNGLLDNAPNQDIGAVTGNESQLFIGRRMTGGDAFLGLIDDVRIYNRLLSAEEIMQIYTEGGGAPPPVNHNLNVSVSGSGTVTSNPPGISCTGTCSTSFLENTSITLTASPSAGSTFTGWSGACSGTNACTFTMNSGTSVAAQFAYDSAPTVSNGKITALDCSQIRVQQAIDSAKDGDIVEVPAGNCSWTPVSASGGAVSINNKSITLKGAGINQTNITLTNAPGYNQSALAIYMSDDKPVRLTGFTFGGNGKYGYIAVYGISKQWRIDHVSNRADGNDVSRLVVVVGDTYGVIDHVQSNASEGGGGMILVRGNDNIAKLTGNTDWMKPANLGGVDAVYIEDSTFNGSRASYTGFASDVENGAKMVFRYNNVLNRQFGSHGAQSSGGRGPRMAEVYNNNFVVDYKVYSTMVWLRGGTGVFFNNTFSRPGGAYGHYIAFDNPRSHTAYGTFGSKCDGTNIWDGNQDPSGYPCLDQIGRSTGEPGHQSLLPAFEWNNKVLETGQDVDIVVLNPPSDIHIVENRDYYNDRCPAGYNPYPYPHPIVQAQDGVAKKTISLNCPGGQIDPNPPVIPPPVVVLPPVVAPPAASPVATQTAQPVQPPVNQPSTPQYTPNTTAPSTPPAYVPNIMRSSPTATPPIRNIPNVYEPYVPSIFRNVVSPPKVQTKPQTSENAVVTGQLSRNLSLNDRGSDVLLLKQYLNSLGYVFSSEDLRSTHFDAKTEQNLKLYQRDHADTGIISSGKLDNITMILIESEIKELKKANEDGALKLLSASSRQDFFKILKEEVSRVSKNTTIKARRLWLDFNDFLMDIRNYILKSIKSDMAYARP